MNTFHSGLRLTDGERALRELEMLKREFKKFKEEMTSKQSLPEEKQEVLKEAKEILKVLDVLNPMTKGQNQIMQKDLRKMAGWVVKLIEEER